MVTFTVCENVTATVSEELYELYIHAKELSAREKAYSVCDYNDYDVWCTLWSEAANAWDEFEMHSRYGLHFKNIGMVRCMYE